MSLIKVENGTSQMIDTVVDLNMVKTIYSYIDSL